MTRPWHYPVNTGDWNEYANASAYASRARVQVRNLAEEMADALMVWMGPDGRRHGDDALLAVGMKLEAIGHTEATGT